MSIVLLGSTSGSCTLQEQAVAGTTTLTLPTTTGTLALTSEVIGVSQTWQAVTGSRAAGTTYTNSTGKPIAVSINVTQTAGTATATLTVGGVDVAKTLMTNSVGYGPILFSIVPNGTTYVLTLTNFSLSTWNELR